MKTLGFWSFTFGCLLLGNYLEGGNLLALIQPTAALMVLLPVTGYFIFSLGISGYAQFLKRIIHQQIQSNDIQILRTGINLGFLLGFVGATFGMIHVMSHLSNSSALGAGMAVAFTSLLYGALPALCFMPLNAKETQMPAQQQPAQSTGFYAAASLAFLLFNFFAVMYSLSNVA